MGVKTRQAVLERRSLARDEATRARRDVRALALRLDEIHNRCTDSGPGRKPLEFKWLSEVKPETLAAITWRRVLARLDKSAETEPEPYVTQIEAARQVSMGVRLELTARAVERELRARAAKQRAKARASGGKARVSVGKKRGDPEWTGTQANRLGVSVPRDLQAKQRANRLVGYLVETCDLLEWDRRRSTCIVLTDKGRDLMAQYWLDAWPVYGPMLVPPLPWSSGLERGGYVADMAGTIKLVERTREPYPSIPRVRRALDMLQSTAWRVNESVYKYASSVQPSTLPISIEGWGDLAANVTPKDRRAKRTLAIAGEVLGSAIYFPQYCDWRGRIYPRPDFFSINSDDLSRGLLRFAEPKPLGRDGEKWLAVHGANKFGLRGTLDARWKWVRENSAVIVAAADNPEDSEILRNAGEHYQFYAFACEWKAYMDSGQGSAFPSSLPCEQDASCNAIQHLAALWRRAKLGVAVNLKPATKPRDIYGETEAKVRAWLRAAPDTPEKIWWLQGDGWRLSRALVKVPVMTLGYGVTKGRARDQIEEALWKRADREGLPTPLGFSMPGRIDARDEFEADQSLRESVSPARRTTNDYLNWLTDVIWEKIIHRELFKAREWFIKSGRAIAAFNQPVQWAVPITGLRVRQDERKYWRKPPESKRMSKGKYGAGGTLKFDVLTDDVDKSKQARALAANVVHSLDAAALVLTVNRLARAGVTAVATVHDAFWVCPADGEALARAGREGFHELHREDVLTNLAQQFQIQAAEVPNPTKYLRRGTLEIDDVLNALYFMS